MPIRKRLIATASLLTCSLACFAQTRMTSSRVKHEILKLAATYQKRPIEMHIHIRNSATSVTSPMDTLQADMLLYYGKNAFYLQTEGLEQILNDSLIILVNAPAKRIMIQRNWPDSTHNQTTSLAMWLPGSPALDLLEQYNASVEDAGANQKRIVLQSRDVVYGTRLASETVTITYHISSHQMVELSRAREQLVPMDSAIFTSLQNDSAFRGRMITVPSAEREQYFLVKQVTTSYIFKEVSYRVLHPPVSERDRVIRQQNGEYVPVNGFEEYVVSTEF